ncbi:secreted with long stretch of threonines mucin [Cryptosporidium sp. chipmunk genotype I]|uniref:secreted with long stretch of threonines mucin n=1 Tax=Cryptosporidium sp. chipmunk genotype I TaxID=1280935 RepID=UPI00351A4F80|nr:secreted with long stretch of threonines mucin [Cryptosporidium sp. chipmunk genotype I]
MRFMLNDSQFQNLGSIINDVNNTKGLECNATSICQISDILFVESEELTASSRCNCYTNANINDEDICNDDDTEESFYCEEKVLLIKAGFSACIRAFTFEGFSCQNTISKVIRILRRFLKGVSIININCNIHKEMLQGLSVIFGMIPDFNIFRVLQAPLKSYLFWCYSQSEDDFVVNNSRILLCVITWMREVSSGNNNNNNNNNNSTNNGPKYGLTLSSQDLLNFLISDLNNSTEQFQQESKLTLNCPNSSILELKKRILRNLELFSILIIYSGFYLPPNSIISNQCQNFFSSGGNLENACKKEAGSLVTTLITLQIMQVLGNLRVIILEEVYKVVDEFVSIYLEKDDLGVEITSNVEVKENLNNKTKPKPIMNDLEIGNKDDDSNKSNHLIKLKILSWMISDIFSIRNSSSKLKNRENSYSYLINQDGNSIGSKHKLFTKVEYVLMLASIQQDIFENMLKVSGKTGLVVYSHMIQEYLISIFSLEYVPSTYYKFQNVEISQFLFKNYYSSILFGFGLVPETRFSDFDYQIFLSFNASMKILEYFEKLFQEIMTIQELTIELTNSNSSSKSNHESYIKFSTLKDVIITKSLTQKLLSLISTYSLANDIVLGLRYTRVVKEFRQKNSNLSFDRKINKYHISSSKVLSNLIIKNCQLFNLNLLGIQNLMNSDPQIRKIFIDLTYHIVNVIYEYYQDSEMILNLAVFSNVNQVFNCILFSLDYNIRDERFEPLINFFRSRIYSDSFSNDKDNDNVFFKPKSLNNVLLNASSCDFSKKDLLYLEYNDEDFAIDPNSKSKFMDINSLPQEQPAFTESHSSSNSSSFLSSSLQIKESKELITTSSMNLDEDRKSESESENLKHDESSKKDLLDMNNIDLSMNLEPSSGEDYE